MRWILRPLTVAIALNTLMPVLGASDGPLLARQAVRFSSAGELPVLLNGEFIWLDRPDLPAVRPGVAICHSDPYCGGSMDDRLVQALASRLACAGMVVLRFNYRLPGDQNRASDSVAAATEDILGALNCLRGNPMVDDARVCLVGHSFGAVVALRATVQAKPKVLAYVGVGFPLADHEVSLSAYSFVRHARSSLLFVSGDADTSSSLLNLKRLTALTGVKAEFVSLVGADHWFSADPVLDELGIHVSAYLRAQVAAVAPTSLSP